MHYLLYIIIKNRYPIRLTKSTAAHDCNGLMRETLKAWYERLVFQRVNQYRRLYCDPNQGFQFLVFPFF